MAVAAFFYSKYVRNVHIVIPFEVIRNSILFKVEIEGETYTFLFDTGANTSISPEIRQKLNIKTIGKNLSSDFYDNISTIEEVIIPELKLGPLVSPQMTVDVVKPIQSFEICDVQIDGYLGLEFFDKKVVHIDIVNKKLTIANSPHFISNISTVPVKMSYHGNQKTPFLSLAIGNDSIKEPILFDTGSDKDLINFRLTTFHKLLIDNTLTPKNIIDTLNKNSGIGMFGPQRDTINYLFNIPKLEIAGVTLENTTLKTFGKKNYSILGSALLNQGTITLDLISDKFYFSPYSLPSLNTERVEGFKLENLTVSSVQEESDAFNKGVRVGQRLIAINRVYFDSLSKCDLYYLDLEHHFYRDTIQFIFTTDKGELVYDYHKGKIE